MTPVRCPEHLAFIRSLPCLVCGRAPSEAAHLPGQRGMGQKRSDLETGPLCRIHHAQQHLVGWPRFILLHDLDVKEILRELREKPRLEVVYRALRIYPLKNGLVDFTAAPRMIHVYQAVYRDQEFELLPVEAGLQASLECAIQVCGEYLRDEMQRRRVA